MECCPCVHNKHERQTCLSLDRANKELMLRSIIITSLPTQLANTRLPTVHHTRGRYTYQTQSRKDRTNKDQLADRAIANRGTTATCTDDQVFACLLCYRRECSGYVEVSVDLGLGNKIRIFFWLCTLRNNPWEQKRLSVIELLPLHLFKRKAEKHDPAADEASSASAPQSGLD